jgi:hypothetical protein
MRRLKSWGWIAAVAVLAAFLLWQPRVEVRLPAPDGKGELVWRCTRGGDPLTRAGGAQAALWPEVGALTKVSAQSMQAAIEDGDPSGVKAADANLEAGLSALSKRIDSEYGCRPVRSSP